jgi:hypothetical protein
VTAGDAAADAESEKNLDLAATEVPAVGPLATTNLDLAAIGPPDKLPVARPLAITSHYDASKIQEWVRTGVALAIVGAVIVETLILTAAFVSGGIAASDLTAATAAIVTPLVGIAGTVLGFYFGSHRGNS